MLAVVLAGGENRRLPITKGFIKIGGRRLIEGLLAGLGGLFDSLAISTNEPEKYYYLGVPLVGDVYPVRGPMTGIFSALSFFNEGAFFIGCDMPFMSVELAARLAQAGRDTGRGWDAIVPVWEGRAEPLFAFYSPRCLPAMEKCVLSGKTSLREFLTGARTVRIDEDEVRGIDPEGLAFVNINTAADLEAALALVPSPPTPLPVGEGGAKRRVRE